MCSSCTGQSLVYSSCTGQSIVFYNEKGQSIALFFSVLMKMGAFSFIITGYFMIV